MAKTEKEILSNHAPAMFKLLKLSSRFIDSAANSQPGLSFNENFEPEFEFILDMGIEKVIEDIEKEINDLPTG